MAVFTYRHRLRIIEAIYDDDNMPRPSRKTVEGAAFNVAVGTLLPADLTDKDIFDATDPEIVALAIDFYGIE